MNESFKETDLFPPIKKYFESIGYSVNGEVQGCDLTAVNGDELIIVELKKSFNLKLLYQALERQKITENVYVAIPMPKRLYDRSFVSLTNLLKKLKLGLILVSMSSAVKNVLIYIEPVTAVVNRKNNKKSSILKEIDGRTIDVNVGGSTGSQILTSYKEKVIKIACCLEKYGKMAARDLKERYGCDRDVWRILNENIYGWFCKVEPKIYDLTQKGRDMLKASSFHEIIEYYMQNL